MLHHEVGRELGGPFHGLVQAIAGILAHLDSDAVTVPGAVMVGMISPLGGGEMLYRAVLISGEMPGNAAQLAVLEREGVAERISPRRPVLGAVNGDVLRCHRGPRPPTTTTRHDILLERDLGHEGTDTARAGAASLDESSAVGGIVEGAIALALDRDGVRVRVATREREREERDAEEREKLIHD